MKGTGIGIVREKSLRYQRKLGFRRPLILILIKGQCLIRSKNDRVHGLERERIRQSPMECSRAPKDDDLRLPHGSHLSHVAPQFAPAQPLSLGSLLCTQSSWQLLWPSVRVWQRSQSLCRWVEGMSLARIDAGIRSQLFGRWSFGGRGHLEFHLRGVSTGKLESKRS